MHDSRFTIHDYDTVTLRYCSEMWVWCKLPKEISRLITQYYYDEVMKEYHSRWINKDRLLNTKWAPKCLAAQVEGWLGYYWDEKSCSFRTLAHFGTSTLDDELVNCRDLNKNSGKYGFVSGFGGVSGGWELPKRYRYSSGVNNKNKISWSI